MQDLTAVFNALVQQYSEKLYWHIRRMVNCHEDADDILQEVYIKVWNALPGFREESALSTWVWRIATNEALTFLRRQKVRAALRLENATAAEIRKIEADPYFNGTAASRELSKAVAALPDKQRQVFVMRWWDGLSYQEISAITGTSEGSLRTSYHIAEKKLKEHLNNTDL